MTRLNSSWALPATMDSHVFNILKVRKNLNNLMILKKRYKRTVVNTVVLMELDFPFLEDVAKKNKSMGMLVKKSNTKVPRKYRHAILPFVCVCACVCKIP